MYQELINKAIMARENSYSPYSHFKVGASLLTENGKIYTGCNIECKSFSPTCCAERVAFFKAVSEGEKNFKAICIVGADDDKSLDYCPPCGVCLQVMNEFCKKNNFVIILAKSEFDYKTYTLNELLPLSF